MDIMEMIRQKKAALQEQSGRREKTVKPQQGKSTWRILPGWRGGDDPTFWHDFGMHFVHGTTPGENGSTLRAVYICTAKTFGTPCPVCDAVSEGLRIAPNDAVVKALEGSKSSNSILVNALHRSGDDPETPVILEMRPSIFRRVLEITDDYGNITDPNSGFDMIITREGRGLNTQYSVTPALNSQPVPAAALQQLHNLDDYVKQEYDEGRMKALASVRESVGQLPSPNYATPNVAESAAQNAATAVSSNEAPPFEPDQRPVIEGQAETQPAPVAQPQTQQAPAATPPPVAQAAGAEVASGPVSMSDKDMEDLLADL